MESLLALDHQLFLVINHAPHTIISDWIALWLSGIGVGGLIWLLISVWLFFREERRDHWFFLPIVMASSLSFLITEILLKHLFARNRPPGAMIQDYSFPSGHATFAWALAIVLAAKEPRAKYYFYLLAFLISLSRIYLGVHYPADIVAGSLVGAAIGLMVQYVYAKVKRQGTPDHPRRRKSGKRH